MTTLLVALCMVVGADRPERRPAHPQWSRAADHQAGTSAETVAAIRVHGNQLTSDDEIVRLAGLVVGQPFLPSTVDEVASRLRQTGRFDAVDVLKRYASIADPSAIAVVIVVNEGPVSVVRPDDPAMPVRVVKRRGLTGVMVLPIVDAEDGYGLTFGARVAYVGVFGSRGRVSFPLTWGGHRQAGAEFERPFTAGPLSRVQLGAALQQVRNPGFDAEDTRRRVWARIERAAGPLRAGGTAEWQRVAFLGSEDEVRSGRVDVTFDTRHDPMLPRNAVLVSASRTWLDFRSGARLHRTRMEGRGYLGLNGQNLLVIRALREGASQPLPPAFQSLLGGSANLRGFEAGTAVGDTLVAGSVELRVPLSSPLRVGRVGLSAFVDAGTVYGARERLGDQPIRSGAGGGVWLSATVFHVSLSVAHGRGGSTRVHFSAGFTH